MTQIEHETKMSHRNYHYGGRREGRRKYTLWVALSWPAESVECRPVASPRWSWSPPPPPTSDVMPHSSTAKPNALAVTLAPTGEAVFEVGRGFPHFRDLWTGETMGNVHTCGPNECVIISGDKSGTSDNSGNFPVVNITNMSHS